MNTKQALTLGIQDLEKMSDKELRKITNTLVSAVNKRSKRIAEAGFYSPVMARYTGMDTSDLSGDDIVSQVEYFRMQKSFSQKTSENGFIYGTLSTRNVPKEQLIDVAEYAKNVLTHETGSLKGTRKFYDVFYKNTGIDLKDLNPEQVYTFMKSFERVNEAKGKATSKYDSLQRMHSIIKLVKSNPKRNFEEITDKYIGKGGVYDTEYQRKQEQYTSIGSFFE